MSSDSSAAPEMAGLGVRLPVDAQIKMSALMAVLKVLLSCICICFCLYLVLYAFGANYRADNIYFFLFYTYYYVSMSNC